MRELLVGAPVLFADETTGRAAGSLAVLRLEELFAELVETPAPTG